MTCPVLIDDSCWPIVVVTLTNDELSARQLSRELAELSQGPHHGGPFSLVLDVRHGALRLDDDGAVDVEPIGLIGRAVVCHGDRPQGAGDANVGAWASFTDVDEAFGWCLDVVTAAAHARHGKRSG